MARLITFLVICCLCRSLLAGPPALPARPAPLISAKSAILIDRDTGLVLWSYNPDQPLPMASTTKIMTAMVLLDHGADKLDQPVTVSASANEVGGNWILTTGDTLSLRDLLKAILISSSNQGTMAVAEYLTNGQPALFMQWMNEKAAEILGPDNHTRFVNPHGLYDKSVGDQHHTSARDLAFITRYALLGYPLIRQIVAEGHPRHKEPITTSPRGVQYLENHNRILGMEVPGIPGSRVDGVKTGFVVKAGKCLVSSATWNGWQVIAVVLGGDGQYFRESLNLLHYGFSRYRWTTYASAEQPGLDAPVAGGAARAVPLGVAGVFGAPTLNPAFGPASQDRLDFKGKRLSAPIRRGQQVGELVLTRDGHYVTSAPAIALQDVPTARWRLVARAILYPGLGLLGLYLLGKVYGAFAKSHRRRRRRVQAQSGRLDPYRARDGQS